MKNYLYQLFYNIYVKLIYYYYYYNVGILKQGREMKRLKVVNEVILLVY